MHIVIGNNIYPPIMAGGAELIVSYLAEGLAARGHRVTVVSTCGPEMEPYPVERRNGVEIVRFFPKNLYWHWTRGDRPGYQKALWHVRDAWNRDAGERFRQILAERQRPNLLHTHLIDGLSAAIWRRAQQAGMKVLHTAHDYHLLCPRSVMLTKSLHLCTDPTLGCRLYRRWHLGTTKHVDLFCSPSRFLIEQHLAAGLAVPTAVVRNGIPLPERHRSSTAAEPRRFIFAARLTVEKGCQVILDAVKQLPADLPFQLDVAGKGPFEDAFRALAASDSRVRFHGYIQGEEKERLFSAADCLLLPSLWYENAPVVIIEAAAYGMGVIGSRIGAIPEFVRPEENGLLFKPGDPASLASAITRVVEDEALRRQFFDGGRPLLAESSVSHMVDAYLEKYQELCG